MPAASLNNKTTTDAYSDALTVVFGRPRASFTLNLSNAAIYYQCAIVSTSARDPAWEPGEHFLVPSLSNFRSPENEGFPPDSQFAGVRVRSAVTGTPATVTVM